MSRQPAGDMENAQVSSKKKSDDVVIEAGASVPKEFGGKQLDGGSVKNARNAAPDRKKYVLY